MSKRPFNFIIDLPMQNHWENVDLVRTSVQNCFTAVFREMDGVHSFATIAAELLENAIKYGRWDEGRPSQLHLRVWGDDAQANVQVENPVDASSLNVAELLSTIDWLKSHGSAEDAYKARLLEVATSPRGVSKLGLARIAYEGGCTLKAEVEGEMLRVTGVTRF
jgi:hypothetical protein